MAGMSLTFDGGYGFDICVALMTVVALFYNAPGL
jgi:hypothetical protein